MSNPSLPLSSSFPLSPILRSIFSFPLLLFYLLPTSFLFTSPIFLYFCLFLYQSSLVSIFICTSLLSPFLFFLTRFIFLCTSLLSLSLLVLHISPQSSSVLLSNFSHYSFSLPVSAFYDSLPLCFSTLFFHAFNLLPASLPLFLFFSSFPSVFLFASQLVLSLSLILSSFLLFLFAIVSFFSPPSLFLYFFSFPFWLPHPYSNLRPFTSVFHSINLLLT